MTALHETPAAGMPTLPAAAGATTAPYVITLPAGLELINSNESQNRHRRARIVKEIRSKAMEAVSECPALMTALAAAKPGPLFQRAHILGILRPATANRRDPANWYPSFKAAVDGLVDAGLLDDDDHTRLVGPDMRLGEKTKGGQLVLVVRGLEPGQDLLNVRAVTR
ncbi:hypothetical protein [Streptomyces lavendulocolor]|uniref:hypothetical protein n=1 Tax=Streptomyces lavendulocolor TaxID=67316 RepID=UPI003C2CB55F